MILHDFLWFAMIFHDFLWFSMVFHYFLWFSMIFCDFPWLSMILHDFLCFSMIFHDFLWFSMVSLLDLSSNISARHPERSMSSELSWAVTRFPNWRPGNVSPRLVINPQLLICLIQLEQQNTEPEVSFKLIWIWFNMYVAVHFLTKLLICHHLTWIPTLLQCV